MLIVSILVLALNVGAILFFYRFSNLPFLNTAAVPFLYALGIVQVVIQCMIRKERDERDRLKIAFRTIFPIVVGVVIVNILSRLLFSFRHNLVDALGSAISILDLVVINLSSLILAVSAAITIALLIAHIIKSIKFMRGSTEHVIH